MNLGMVQIAWWRPAGSPCIVPESHMAVRIYDGSRIEGPSCVVSSTVRELDRDAHLGPLSVAIYPGWLALW